MSGVTKRRRSLSQSLASTTPRDLLKPRLPLPFLVVFSGPAGSGKTTAADTFATLLGGSHVPRIEVSTIVGQALGVTDRASKLRPDYSALEQREGADWLGKRLEIEVQKASWPVVLIVGLREWRPFCYLQQRYHNTQLVFLKPPLKERCARLAKRDRLTRAALKRRLAKEARVFGADMRRLEAAAVLHITD